MSWLHNADEETREQYLVRAMQWLLETATRLEQKVDKIMATLDDVMNDMTEETTAIGGLSTLIAGLKQQLVDALSSTTLPPAVQAKVDAVFASAEANKASLALALGANTTPPPPPPDQPAV